MKKRNGFTLIELLAVIVVLAIIMVIALPNILSTMNKSKKESFYLYAKSLESKAIAQYTQDVTQITRGNVSNADGIVYRIHKTESGGCPEGDTYCLDIPDSNLYDGYIKVYREIMPDDKSELKDLNVSINNSPSKVKSAYYCMGSACNPNIPIPVKNEPSTTTGNVRYNVSFEVDYKKPTDPNTVLRFNYTYEDDDNKKIISSSPIDVIFNSAGAEIGNLEYTLTGVNSSYNYIVKLSLRSDNYAVENFVMSNTENSSDGDKIDKSQQESFYEAISTYENSHHGRFGDLVLDENYHLLMKGSENCNNDITNTAFTISFDANGGVLDPSSTVQLGNINANASSKGTFEMANLPLMKKDNYNDNDGNGKYEFNGWYYDKECTRKVELKDIKVDGYTHQGYLISAPYNYDGKKCLAGYKDVVLYAKYSKLDKDGKVISTSQAKGKETTTRETKSNTITEKTTDYKTITDPSEKVIVQKPIDEKTTVDTNDTSILLDSLTMDNYDLGFYYGKFIYELTVPNSIQNVNVHATAKDPNSIVTISGTENLIVGHNLVIINVLNPTTGKEANYVIKIARLDELGRIVDVERKTVATKQDENTPDPEDLSSNAQIDRISISGHVISFKKTVYDYTIKLKPDETELIFIYSTVNKRAYSNIIGNKDLKDGSVIEIKVTSQNGFYNKSYKFHIVKPYVETSSTKVLKYIVIGLVVVLIGLAIYINIKKKKELKPLGEEEDINNIYRTDNNGQAMTDSVAVSDSGVQQVAVDNNQVIDQNPNGYVGMQHVEQPVKSVFDNNQSNSSNPNNNGNNL